MPTPGGLVTQQELIDATGDTRHLGEVSNGLDASGNPIDTSISRLGEEHLTVNGITKQVEQYVLDAVGLTANIVKYSDGGQIVLNGVDPNNKLYSKNQSIWYAAATHRWIGDDSELPYDFTSLPFDDTKWEIVRTDVFGFTYSEIVAADIDRITPKDPNTGLPYGGIFSAELYVAGTKVYESDDNGATFNWSVVNKTDLVKNGTLFRAGDEVEIRINREVSATSDSNTGGSQSGVWFGSVALMKSNTRWDGAIDLPNMAENNDVVSTAGYYNAVDGQGWGHYTLWSIDSYRTAISDPTWEPDGDRDHYVGVGNLYVAILLVAEKGVEHITQWGVITQDETIAVANENIRKINACVEYICPYEWKGSVQATYYDVALAGGVVQWPRGFTSVTSTVLINPHVEHRGLNPVPRIFGKVNPSAGEQLAYVKYVGPEENRLVLDTANYKDSVGGVRVTDSTASFFNSSIDNKETAYSEGSFIRNLGIIVGNAAGGFRLAAAMKGGYDGVSVSGGIYSYMLSNCWNMTLGSIWTEESYYARLGFETTNLRFAGQTSFIGNSSTKLVVPDSAFTRIPQYFGSNFAADDDNTIPLVHLKQSKASFEAFCWDTVYDNLTTEFWANPLCSYGNIGETYLTVNNWSEEANADTMDINGNIGVKSVLVTGFNTQVRLHGMSSISDTPTQALGTNSVMYVTEAKRWSGDSIYPDHMDNVTRGNAFILEDLRAITPKLRMDHNVSIRGNKRDISFWYDEAAGSELYFGIDSSQPAKLNNFFVGIVQSSTTAGVYTRKPVNQSFEYTLRLLGNQAHLVGDDSSTTTVGLSDNVRVRVVRNGGTTTNTSIQDKGFTFKGPLLNSVNMKFEGVTLNNTDVTSLQAEGNGIFRLSGVNTLEFIDVICKATDTDAVIFSGMSATYTTVQYRNGDMSAINVAGGLFAAVTGNEAVFDGIISPSGVNQGKSAPAMTGLTNRVVV